MVALTVADGTDGSIGSRLDYEGIVSLFLLAWRWLVFFQIKVILHGKSILDRISGWWMVRPFQCLKSLVGREEEPICVLVVL